MLIESTDGRVFIPKLEKPSWKRLGKFYKKLEKVGKSWKKLEKVGNSRNVSACYLVTTNRLTISERLLAVLRMTTVPVMQLI